MSYESFRNTYLQVTEARLDALNIGASSTANELLAAGALYKMAAAVAELSVDGSAMVALLSSMSGSQLQTWLQTSANATTFTTAIADHAVMASIAYSQPAMAAIAGSAAAVGLVVGNAEAAAQVALSYTAILAVRNQPTALAAFIADAQASRLLASSQIAMDLFAVNTAAMTTIAASPTMMAAILGSGVAMVAIFGSAAALNVLVQNSQAMQAMAASGSAMAQVAGSASAMAIILGSSTAMTAVFGNSTARGAIHASTIAVDAIRDTPAAITWLRANKMTTATVNIGGAGAAANVAVMTGVSKAISLSVKSSGINSGSVTYSLKTKTAGTTAAAVVPLSSVATNTVAAYTSFVVACSTNVPATGNETYYPVIEFVVMD